MSELRVSLDEYLRLRRSLGYKLERAGKVLAGFVDFLDDTGATHISVEVAVAWAIQAPGAESSWRAGRLGMVRCFARYLQAIDTRHQVPPTGLIPRRRGRPTPYLFSEADIATVMAAADEIRSPLRRSTIETLIGTLAVTGLRVGEVIRLDRGDLDVDTGVLVVRNSKGGKSRHVPLDPSTLAALVAYRSHRDRLFPTLRACSSRPPAAAYAPAISGPPSPSWWRGQVSNREREDNDRASAVCVTASRCGPCSASTPPAPTRCCRCCRRIWDMSARVHLLVSVRRARAPRGRRAAS